MRTVAIHGVQHNQLYLVDGRCSPRDSGTWGIKRLPQFDMWVHTGIVYNKACVHMRVWYTYMPGTGMHHNIRT